MRTSLLANATTTTFWCVRPSSCASQSLRPGACFCLCCSTLRAPCTKSLRKYLLPRLLMPSNFCLPPLECSPGTIPIQADSARPFPKALPLPIAPIKAVAVTGPTPGISVSRWQASFSFAVFWMTRSICSMRAASCSSSNLSCANRTRNAPDNLNSASSRIRGSNASTWLRPLGRVNPRSRRRLRIWFTTAVRRITSARAPDAALQVQLFLCLDRHKTHPRSLHGFGNGFRIDVVALVRFNVGLHVLGRHQTHFVPLRSQSPPEEVRPTTRLHADQLHLQIRGEGQQLRARTSLPYYHLPTGIQTNQMKHGLTQINTQSVDFHEMPPCPALYNFYRSAADHPINWGTRTRRLGEYGRLPAECVASLPTQ